VQHYLDLVRGARLAISAGSLDAFLNERRALLRQDLAGEPGDSAEGLRE
jgi:hypothetical protein